MSTENSDEQSSSANPVKKQPVTPDNDDICSIKEIDSQRLKWTEFLKARKFSLSETWLWQYWRPESRPSTKIGKKFMTIFSSKLKSQKQVKELIRNGIPPELRGDIWWACSVSRQ